jgi:homoserine kinase
VRTHQLVTGQVRVRVPASSANLGPGFDSLGLALELHDLVTAEVCPAGAAASPVISVAGEGAGEVPLDESHLVHRAMVRAFAAMGVPTPVVRLHCENAIPHGRGLGSSSAAIVAGLSVARALVTDGADRLDRDELFALAAEIEGHPDNVAPAVYGGFTVSYSDGGRFHAARLTVTSPVSFVVFVPAEPLATETARGLLPATVPHSDAARNAGRAALLLVALTGRPDLLLAATEDRLHQDYRAPAMPESAALIARLREVGYAAVVSGAGPTVLAVVAPDDIPAVTAQAPAGWQVRELSVDPDGAHELR